MPRSLLEHLAELPDPRGTRGRQYPLIGLLQLAVLAMLSGKTTLVDIAHFGRQHGLTLGHALGFRNAHMPCANTFANLFRKLDPDRFDAILGAWILENHVEPNEPIAIDGKVLRGSQDGDVPGLHLLAAYAPQAAAVIGQIVVGAKTNEHKTLLRLLKILPPLTGRVVTADAMFTHRDVAEKVLEKEADYILYAKDNQTELKTEIAFNFQSATYGQFSPLDAERVGGGLRHRSHA